MADSSSSSSSKVVPRKVAVFKDPIANIYVFDLAKGTEPFSYIDSEKVEYWRKLFDNYSKMQSELRVLYLVQRGKK